MSRLWMHVALVFCLVWQAGALAYSGAPSGHQSDATHAGMHLEMQAHHHDADGSLAVDDSAASLLHMIADLGGAVTMLRESPLHLLPTANAAPQSRPGDTVAPPFLEGPLRPPRPFA